MSEMPEWTVLPHREVKNKDIPLLEESGLKEDFDEIVAALKQNPYQQIRNMELLKPRQKRFIPCASIFSTVLFTRLKRKIKLLRYGQLGRIISVGCRRIKRQGS